MKDKDLSEHLSVEGDGCLIYVDNRYDTGPAMCFPVRGVEISSYGGTFTVENYYFTLDIDDRYRR